MNVAIPDNLKFDWLPPALRTKEQLLLTEEFHEQIGRWADLQFAMADMPARVLDYELEKLAIGQLLPRPYQFSGSCVGVSWWRAFCNAAIGDVVFRGDIEDPSKLAFPFATYGVGRQLAGMRSRGDGSFGSAQAKAGAQFGALPINHPGLPSPTISNGWLQYSKSVEIQWSHPSGWPTPVDELQQTSKKYAIGSYKKLESAADVKEAKALGYGVTLASSFGSRGMSVKDDVLLATWNGSWAHQMSCAGYWEHQSLGQLFVIDNQWKDAHGKCPTLSPLGVIGSFWIESKTMDRICDNGEVYAHTATGGFELTSIDWKNLGIQYA